VTFGSLKLAHVTHMNTWVSLTFHLTFQTSKHILDPLELACGTTSTTSPKSSLCFHI